MKILHLQPNAGRYWSAWRARTRINALRKLAAVLAEAVRTGSLQAADALRVIRHEMRGRNTNKKSTLPYRSSRAQAVIDDYADRGEPVPRNGSDDALHADHVYDSVPTT